MTEQEVEALLRSTVPVRAPRRPQARPLGRWAVAAAVLMALGVSWWIVRPEPDRAHVSSVDAPAPFVFAAQDEAYFEKAEDDLRKRIERIDSPEAKALLQLRLAILLVQHAELPTADARRLLIGASDLAQDVLWNLEGHRIAYEAYVLLARVRHAQGMRTADAVEAAKAFREGALFARKPWDAVPIDDANRPLLLRAAYWESRCTAALGKDGQAVLKDARGKLKAEDVDIEEAVLLEDLGAVEPLTDRFLRFYLTIDAAPVDALRLAKLLTDLEDEDLDVRDRAATELSKGGIATWRTLRQADLGRYAPEIRAQAEALLREFDAMARRIGGHGLDRSVPFLVYLARHPESTVRDQALKRARSILPGFSGKDASSLRAYWTSSSFVWDPDAGHYRPK